MPLQIAEQAKKFARPSPLGNVLSLVAEKQRVGEPVISFAGGLPVNEILSEIVAPDLLEIYTGILTDPDRARTALQYAGPEGYLPLREAIATEIGAPPEHIIPTIGLQQGIEMAAYVVCDRGDVVLTEQATYAGALSAFATQQVEVWGLPTDESGIIPEAVGEAVQVARGEGKRVGLLYVQNVGNPDTGQILTQERGMDLLGKAQTHNFALFQDDAYKGLVFDSDVTAAEPLSKFDPNRVIYGVTFSKTVAPGIRLGAITAPSVMMPALRGLQMGRDISPPPFIQMAVTEYIIKGKLRQNLPKIQQEYRTRRDAMVDALKVEGNDVLEWHHPRGGMFVFVKNTRGISADAVVEKVIRDQDVVYLPPAAFYPPRIIGDTEENALERSRWMRLNFTNTAPDKMQDGIRALVRGITDDQLQG